MIPLPATLPARPFATLALALALSSAAAAPARPRHAEPPAAPVFDCNENGVEDAVDIAIGTSGDTNENGIPDECESRAK